MRILIIDDDEDLLTNFRKICHQSDFVITAVSTPLQAISCAYKSLFDIVIANIEWSSISGLDMLGIINKLQPGIRTIIFCSKELFQKKASNFPVAIYKSFQKPFRLQTLYRTIKNIENELGDS